MRAQSDEGDATFSEFVSSAGGGLLRFAILLTGNRNSAEDLLQDVLEKTYPHWRRVSQGHPHAYVRRAMVNRVTSWRRSPTYRSRSGSLEDRKDDVAADEVARVDARDAARRALANLPPKMRAVVVLRYWADLSEAQVAHELRCSTGTVKSLASRGLERLRSDEFVAAEFGDHKGERHGA